MASGMSPSAKLIGAKIRAEARSERVVRARRADRTRRWALALIAALAPSCAGDYPLAPTPCDEWCGATTGFTCEYYEPASCVLQCEEAGLANSRCSALMEATVACFRNAPAAVKAKCDQAYGIITDTPEANACALENAAFAACVGSDPNFGR